VPNLFSIHTLQLDDGLEFSFTDKRRFARVRLLDDVGASKVLVNYVEILALSILYKFPRSHVLFAA
jgi:hypothetical protein